MRPEVIQALMTPDAHLEIVLAVLSRSSVTVQHLTWAAGFDNAQVLGRVVSNLKSPVPLIREIRDRAAGRDGDIWAELRAYADRVLDRIAGETGLHRGTS